MGDQQGPGRVVTDGEGKRRPVTRPEPLQAGVPAAEGEWATQLDDAALVPGAPGYLSALQQRLGNRAVARLVEEAKSGGKAPARADRLQPGLTAADGELIPWPDHLPLPGAPADLMALQERLGNWAVQRLVAQAKAAPPKKGDKSGGKAGASKRTDSEDPKLAEQIKADLDSGGLVVATYVLEHPPPPKGKKPPHEEFQDQAAQYAVDHQATGLSGGKVVRGRKNAAMAMDDSLLGRLQGLKEGVEALLSPKSKPASTAELEPAGIPQSKPASTPFRIRALAVFTHGLPEKLKERLPHAGEKYSKWIKNVDTFAKGLAPYLAAGANIILYACLTGLGKASWKAKGGKQQLPSIEFLKKEKRRQLVAEYRDKKKIKDWQKVVDRECQAYANMLDRSIENTSFAERLQHQLSEELAKGRGEKDSRQKPPEVWAHEIEAHTVFNVYLRGFTGKEEGGSPLLAGLGEKMADRAMDDLILAKEQKEAIRAKANAKATEYVKKLMKKEASHNTPRDARAVYFREIPLMGLDKVWEQVSGQDKSRDFSKYVATDTAQKLMADGLDIYQKHFAEALKRLKQDISSMISEK